eukprot:TRINITY_DN18559_c0_g1_i1.p1 TRINITY_DN18559_c0_g1~~TRINITY_DN18559_c0_g1_i1.p1  ORF type:complete len:266 (+),score=63.04 TRINITY_DN18559_c0_g1_i1:274-1071(+)
MQWQAGENLDAHPSHSSLQPQESLHVAAAPGFAEMIHSAPLLDTVPVQATSCSSAQSSRGWWQESESVESLAWSEAAAPWLAEHLPNAASKMQSRFQAQSSLGLGLPEKQRPGFRLLAKVLRESGSDYDDVANAALALASGCSFQSGAAELIYRTGPLSAERRLVFARALCTCCPEILLPVLPPSFMVSNAGSVIQAAREAQVRINMKAAAAEARANKVRQELVCRLAARSAAAEARARTLRQVTEAHRAAVANVRMDWRRRHFR